VAIHPTIERYVDEPTHLLDSSEDAPLYIPTPEEVYALTGKRLIAEDYYQYFDDTPFNLELGSGPTVLGTFEWSNLWVDNEANADLTSYFTQAVLIGDESVYNSWRVRGLYRGGYMLAYYGTSPPSRTPPGTINAIVQGNQGFTRVGNGFHLSLGGGNLIIQYQGHYYFNGGNQDIWFPIKFQVEVGYGDPNYLANDPHGNLNWPAFTAGVGTDLLQYRGWNPNYACFNGLANAPNVIALGGCPYTGQGGYTPPDPPEDL
jgi:hypothetical protein